ncbi:hypothetical protein [Inhella proteolytica]|uniref:AlpA family phage regulatory protein n=1 Tax=Inhella proteolytica TaxID=2795029 RepID=A0A931J844_9BURK|nr:hypothetical protein [Inhella proteolytica]MBH9577860.1 hypothetical protein [Inhella proteolytica]
MGVSWWLAEVAAGRAPKPAIQQPRCTRWRLKDVREFWACRAEQADQEATARLTAQAAKASAAASAQRRGKSPATVEG